MVTKTLERAQKTTVRAARPYDKRYFPRWEVNKRVECSGDGGVVFRTYTKDLSLDGASIFVVGDPPVQHHVQVKIHLADKETFKAHGHVTWSRIESSHKLLGIVFEDLSPRAQELIMRHAFELKEDHILICG